MKISKQKLMENAGLLNERELEDNYSQMVGSWAANYVGFRVTVNGSKSLEGGSISGDFLVVGYGRLITNPTGEFNATSRPNAEVLIVQDENSSQLRSIVLSASELNSKVQVIVKR